MEPTTGRIRRGYTVPFAQIPNSILQSTTLSLKAIGLYAKIISYPPDFIFYKTTLDQYCKDGRDSLTSAFDELVEAGYITSRRLKNNGRFAGWEHEIHLEPQLVAPDTGFPDMVASDTTECHLNINTITEEYLALKKNNGVGLTQNGKTATPPEIFSEKKETAVTEENKVGGAAQRLSFKQEMIAYMGITKKNYPEGIWQDFYIHFCELNEKTGLIRRFASGDYFELHGRLLKWYRDTHPAKNKKHWEAHVAKYGSRESTGRIFELKY